jgi:hypothetical protein
MADSPESSGKTGALMDPRAAPGEPEFHPVEQEAQPAAQNPAPPAREHPLQDECWKTLIRQAGIFIRRCVEWFFRGGGG